MCTLVSIRTKNNSIITGRTNDFTAYYESELIFEPRNKEFNSSFSFNKNKWNNKYSFIHQTSPGMLDNPEISVDGLNEKGLSVSWLYYRYHEYKELQEDQIKPNNINFIYLSTYLLGNFKDVKEIKDNVLFLEDMFYWSKGMDQSNLGQRLSITDKEGNSIVIEPEHKKLLIRDNPLGVLTNSLPLKYHYENVDKYEYLKENKNSNIRPLKGYKDNVSGTNDDGLKGIPGDFSPDSRFIRTSILSSLIEEVDNEEDGVNTVFRLLNTADILPGFVNEELSDKEVIETKEMFKSTLFSKKNKNVILDHTDNIIVKDLKNLRLYYKTNKNISIRYIDFKSMIDDEKVSRIKIDKDKSIKFIKVKTSIEKGY